MRKVVIAALMLGGCATKVTAFTAPDGRPAYIASCGGTMRSITECYDAARKQCGGNYDVLRLNDAPRADGGQIREVEFSCKV